jgi:hypothetical protein
VEAAARIPGPGGLGAGLEAERRRERVDPAGPEQRDRPHVDPPRDDGVAGVGVPAIDRHREPLRQFLERQAGPVEREAAG